MRWAGLFAAALLFLTGCGSDPHTPVLEDGWGVWLGENGAQSRGRALAPADGGYLVTGSTTAPGTFRPSMGAFWTTDRVGVPTGSARTTVPNINSYFGAVRTSQGFMLAGQTSDQVMMVELSPQGKEEQVAALPLGTLGTRFRPASDGGFWLVGHRLQSSPLHPSGRLDLEVFRLDATGMPLWSTLLGGDDTETGLDVSEMPDGGCVVVGRTDSAGPEPAIFTARLGAGGGVLWTRTLADTLPVAPRNILAAEDGAIYVSADIATQGWDVLLVRLDPHGSTLWRKIYGDGGPQQERGAALAWSGSGSLWLAATIEDADLWLLEMDRQGNLLRSGRGTADRGLFTAEVRPGAGGAPLILASSLNSGKALLLQAGPDFELSPAQP